MNKTFQEFLAEAANGQDFDYFAVEEAFESQGREHLQEETKTLDEFLFGKEI